MSIVHFPKFTAGIVGVVVGNAPQQIVAEFKNANSCHRYLLPDQHFYAFIALTKASSALSSSAELNFT